MGGLVDELIFGGSRPRGRARPPMRYARTTRAHTHTHTRNGRDADCCARAYVPRDESRIASDAASSVLSTLQSPRLVCVRGYTRVVASNQLRPPMNSGKLGPEPV